MWPRNAAGLMVSLTLGHFESGSIPPWTALAAAPLRLSRAGIGGPFRAKKQAAIPVRCEAATGPVPVEPQLTCYHPPIHHHPGCHRPCAGGATTDVLPGARANRRRSRRYVSNAPRASTATRHSAVGCGLMWPRNAAGLMVSLTLGHFESGSIAPWTALAAAPLRLSRAGIGGPFRAKKQAAIPVRCEAATGPVPVEPQLTCYQPPIHHHPGCHRPCAGGATTGVLPGAHANRRRSRRYVSNAPARNRDRNPCDTATTRPQVAG